MIVKLLTEPFGVTKLKRRLQRLIRIYTFKMSNCWNSHAAAQTLSLRSLIFYFFDWPITNGFDSNIRWVFFFKRIPNNPDPSRCFRNKVSSIFWGFNVA